MLPLHGSILAYTVSMKYFKKSRYVYLLFLIDYYSTEYQFSGLGRESGC